MKQSTWIYIPTTIKVIVIYYLRNAMVTDVKSIELKPAKKSIKSIIDLKDFLTLEPGQKLYHVIANYYLSLIERSDNINIRH